MAGQVKIAVLVLVLITAAKRFSAADEESGYTVGESPTAERQESATSAVQEASQGPEQTAQHVGKCAELYTTELCNTFFQFWVKQSLVLLFRSTGDFIQCTWFKRDSCDGTGVTLTRRIYMASGGYMKTLEQRHWKFGENNSMSSAESGGTHVKTLLYKDENFTCGVVRYEYFMDADDELKKDIEQECKENPHMEHCQGERPCTVKSNDPEEFVCRYRTHYELFVDQAHKRNVPEDCIQFYNKTLGSRRYTENRDIDSCLYEEDSG